MGDDAGGAASQLPQTSASLPPRPCAGCSMPFVPKTNNPDEKYCTKKCLKLFKTQQQPARQSARRRHSLNNTLPGTPQLVGEAGSKRPLSPDLSPTATSVTGPAHKKGKRKNDVTSLLSTLSRVTFSSLGKPDLVAYLESCVSCLMDLQTSDQQASANNAAHLDRLRVLEGTVQSLKTEIVDIKVAFADKTLSAIRANPAPRTYADSVRGSVLVASFADGKKPTDPINVAALEKLIDTESTGLIPQSVKEKDDKIYMTFNDSADASKAATVFKNHAACSSVFKEVSPLEVLFPFVAHFVDVSDLTRLQTEIEYRNPLFKGRISSLKKIYTKPKTNIGHVNNFLRTRQAKTDVLRRGTLYCNDGSYRVVEPDINREVRRCYNCQRYGHTQHSCKAKSPACGKCAGPHRTNGCEKGKKEWKCVNCSGCHQTGDREWALQIRAVERYRTFLSQ